MIQWRGVWPAHEKRAYVRAMFARIAPRYDLLNRLITLGQDQSWRARAARCAIAGQSAPRVLDLATGTGDLAFLIKQQAPHAQVVGLDLVPEMLAWARRKKSFRETAFLVGDALELPFADATFDAVTSAFMLRNLVDLERAFHEMMRVARPGARIVALEITQPRLPVWRLLYRLYLYRLVPLVGGMLSDADAYRYLPASLTAFVSAEELARLLQRVGLREVRYELLNLGTVALHVGLRL